MKLSEVTDFSLPSSLPRRAFDSDEPDALPSRKPPFSVSECIYRLAGDVQIEKTGKVLLD
ncbi:TPA: hypothetical protein DCY68_01090 [Candidatus Azambacteria bacterium]|nr:hypothetical protein [Candidatus Azambacteria bacterium]